MQVDKACDNIKCLKHEECACHEAVLFVLLFGAMSVASIIISKRYLCS